MGKIVKMKITGLLLLALLPLLAVSIAYATRPAEGNGTVTLVHSQKIGASRIANDNTIVTLNNTFSISGTLSGTALAIERDVIHNSTGKVNFHGVAKFSGHVGTKSGTLMINYVGRNTGTSIQGQFVILSGTDDLANLRGQGTFSGKPGMALNYVINWHFDPAK